ncbi:MAG: hypothetical protein HQK55_00285 [Deltaproteobacteria bacterium]|nr:hypothetical protein [Deltaproteobacteria bacterium]
MAKIDELEVTGILDPDLKNKSLTLTEEDIDFELEEALSEIGSIKNPKKKTSDAWENNNIKIPPKKIDAIDDDILDLNGMEMEIDENLAEQEGDDIDFVFSLDDEIGEDINKEKENEDMVSSLAAPQPDEIEEDIDFELEEVVELAEPASLKTDVNLEDQHPVLTVDMEEFPTGAIPVTTSGTGSIDMPQPQVAPQPFPLDTAKLEELIVQTVRETVSQALQKMLPGLLEEILSKELEKLRMELEEI